MREIKKIYKLQTHYTITAFEVDEENGERSYPRMTQERLAIEDTFDLENSMSLTKVLGIIDRIHDVIRDAI